MESLFITLLMLKLLKLQFLKMEQMFFFYFKLLIFNQDL